MKIDYAKFDLTGCVMVGLDGLNLSMKDRERLAQSAVGGVCLFTRNFKDKEQLTKLIKDARDCVNKKLVVAVDQEGGRVQRFVGPGFPKLRSPRSIGTSYEKDKNLGVNEAIEHGLEIARQLKSVDIDLFLGPSLDIDYGRNPMIDSRCFGSDPLAVTTLALAFCQGLAEYNFPAIGKHFPGHGWANADSHLEIPRDARSIESIVTSDLIPYVQLLKHKQLISIMISHVNYSRFSPLPGTYSKEIIKELLKDKLKFTGKVMTDDLVMEGANVGLDMVDRSIVAKQAGCDLYLWLGGEPVLLDEQLKRVPAVGDKETPWLELLQTEKITRIS